MVRSHFFASFVIATLVTIGRGQDYEVSEISSGPTGDGVPTELASKCDSKGLKIAKGSSRSICEIWLGSTLEVVADFKETDDRLYPFQEGQWLGLIHYPRRTTDFRNQTIESGWYSLRFELQPVDGNHVGTSPTRDFLVMVKAENDLADKQWDTKELLTASAEVAGTSHPAMMCLQRLDKATENKVALRHNEEKDWWILRLLGKGSASGKAQDVVLDMVVAGHAAE